MITGAQRGFGFGLRRRWRHLVERLAQPPLILMYHRIADDPIDPWQLCVSPACFDAQMALLRRRRRPMRLSALVDALERGQCPRQAVVVTFDDGYRDNLTAALPVLETHQVPATVFCTAAAIGREEGFWWDRLAVLLLGPERLPEVLACAFGGEHKRFDLGAATRYDAAERAADRQRPADDDGASPRLAFYREVWSRLRPLAESDRAAALDQVALWAGNGAAVAPRALTHEDARTLAASPLIDIGAHSVTHAALATLAPQAQRDEIGRSKSMLEQLLGRPVVSFAYPFGDQGSDTAAMVREAGFRAACTTHSAPVRARTDPLQLPRFAVGDWDAPTFARALWDGA